MRISIGSDHAGFERRKKVAGWLRAAGHEVLDLGPRSDGSCDYPEYAYAVARSLRAGDAERGVLLCGTGIGMSMAANRVGGVRAALCTSPEMAKLARAHNDANVLVLPGRLLSDGEAEEILDAWLAVEFEGGRHGRRVDEIDRPAFGGGNLMSPPGGGHPSFLFAADPEIAAAVVGERRRQETKLELIASENFASEAVLEALATPMNNKYAEGYPGKRYYGGCEFVDVAEELAIERAKNLYGADHANVQPHSGASANIAAFFSLLEYGDTILGMSLSHGGHLTHGHPVNFSGRFFKVAQYEVSRETEALDYDAVAAVAREAKPKMIIAGYSAYSRTIDFAAFRKIADDVGAYLMVDMAHIAGLIAAGLHPNPVPFADLVTSTTHKTLRGPRGGLILCKAEHAEAVDKTTFPGMQGGPLEHCIAAKAVCFREAMTPEFRAYQQRVIDNAKALAASLMKRGFAIVSGGTDNHLMLVNLTDKGVSGKKIEIALDEAGITANKNTVPFDERKPWITSGIRLGTPAVTTRGMGTDEMDRIADLIARVVEDPKNEEHLAAVRADVEDLCARFPLYRG
ncbi:MAG: ribose 5-phosphate isomerase B [Candidatus Eisenbacteria bacterium]